MAEMGRPKKSSTEHIKNIIDEYVSFTGGTVLLNASKIAEYADKNLGIKNFKYYDINRNPEAKKYVEDLNKEISKGEDKKITSSVTNFSHIDVQSYLSMNKEQLGKALANLNTEREDMADSNTKLLKENIALKDSLRTKNIEIKKLNDLVNATVKGSTENMDEFKRTINEQREIISRLKQTIKQFDDANHLLWDKEAKIIMKHAGVFDNDGVTVNPKRIITDIEKSMIPVVKDANTLESGKVSEKICSTFMDRLRKI